MDVTEFLDLQDTSKLIATKTCPAGSAVDKVEVYARFRLVHWKPGVDPGESGGFDLENDTPEIQGKTKKITYYFVVLFDEALMKTADQSKIGKWDNASVFYHEMLHGQLALNRIKDPKWSGWETACKCKTPNPKFIAKEVKTADEDHRTISPATEAYLVAVLKDKENLSVTVITTTDITDGDLKFEKEIKLPDNILEKADKSVYFINPENLDGDPTYELNTAKGTIVIKGKVKQQPGRVVVAIDPPSVGAVLQLSLLAPPPAIEDEEQGTPALAVLAKFWWLYLAGFLLVLILYIRRR